VSCKTFLKRQNNNWGKANEVLQKQAKTKKAAYRSGFF